jgi:autotransporter translocation and assembly factor TamB
MTARTVIRRALLVIAVVIAVMAVGVSLLLWSPWGRGYLRDLAERQAEAFLNADVEIGGLDGSLLFGATLHDLVIARDDRRLLAIDRVRVDYSITGLLAGQLGFPLISLDHLVMRAEAIPALLPERKPGAGGGRSFTLDRVLIDQGEITIGPTPAQVGGFRVPDVIRDLNAELSVNAGPDRTVVDVKRLSFVGEAPAVTIKRFSGAVTLADGDLVLDRVNVQLAESSLTFSARIDNFRKLGGNNAED